MAASPIGRTESLIGIVQSGSVKHRVIEQQSSISSLLRLMLRQIFCPPTASGPAIESLSGPAGRRWRNGIHGFGNLELGCRNRRDEI
jgi:hypothetical protein